MYGGAIDGRSTFGYCSVLSPRLISPFASAPHGCQDRCEHDASPGGAGHDGDDGRGRTEICATIRKGVVSPRVGRERHLVASNRGEGNGARLGARGLDQGARCEARGRKAACRHGRDWPVGGAAGEPGTDHRRPPAANPGKAGGREIVSLQVIGPQRFGVQVGP